MKILHKIHARKRWFSILMALGIIAILMIVVTGLSVMYLKEFKLSRLSYDEILASTLSEGTFEYGMLKIKNHEAGFQDEMTGSIIDAESDLDGKMFTLSTDRSKNIVTHYHIQAAWKDYTHELRAGENLVIPLFVGDSKLLENTKKSKDPLSNTGITITKWIKLDTHNNGDISWNVSAENTDSTDLYNQNIILFGTGNIESHTTGNINFWGMLCVWTTWNGSSTQVSQNDGIRCEQNSWYKSASPNNRETNLYAYNRNTKVQEFVEKSDTNNPITLNEARHDGDTKISHPYLIIRNNGTTTQEIKITANTNFTLPEWKIESIARQWDASQVFSLTQNRQKFYESLLQDYAGNLSGY